MNKKGKHMDKHTLVTLRGVAGELMETACKLRAAIAVQDECMGHISEALKKTEPGSRAESLVGDILRRRLCMTNVEIMAMQAEALADYCKEQLDRPAPTPKKRAIFSPFLSTGAAMSVDAVEVVA
ncbi:MAG: hypothetical protein EOM20_19625 [Spartobacteria bacterium]|nr:hypothetical protein [Spartobacteria bacterium]